MKIAMRRRLAVAAVLSMTATVGAVMFNASESSATVSNVQPGAAGNFPPQPTLVTFTLVAHNPSPPSNPGDGRVPLGSNVIWTRSGTGTSSTNPADAFDTTVDSYPGTPPNQQQPQTGADFSNVLDDTSGNSEGPANPGPYDVVFKDPSFVQTLDACNACFTVVAAGPPTVVTANPNKVASNTTANVTFTGANFARGTTFSILPSTGNTATDIKVVQARDSSNKKINPSSDGKNYFATVTIPPGAALGLRDVQATNTDGQTSICTGCFTVLGANLTSVSPGGSTNNDTDNARSITFFGPPGSMASDGVPSLEFVNNPGGTTRDALRIVGTNVTHANDLSSTTGTFNLAAVAPGSNAYQPTVTSASGGTVNVCGCRFSVVQPTAPTLTGLNPNTQDRGTTQQVTVSGTNFSRGTNVTIVGAGVTTTSVAYVSRTQVKATFVVDGAAAAGKRDVQVALTDGQTGTLVGGYTINGNSPGATPSTRPPSPSNTACPSTTASPTRSATATPSATSTATVSPSASSTASPTASATASSTASPTASATASSTASATSCTPLTISVSPRDIVPTQASTVFVHGAANQPVQIWAYSRPSTTYAVVRSGTTNSGGNIAWTVTPGGNTRLYAHYAGGSGSTATNDSPTTVITVHTSLSLSAYRDSVRKYHFQGTNLPRRAGQLITLYRYAKGPNHDQYCVPTAESDTTAKDDAGCTAIITSQAKTGANNTWRIDRTFKGNGQFYFVVRTSENINNGRGHSNQRLTVIK